MANLVTLVNRTTHTLEGTWDGRHYALTPGKHAFTEVMAQKFKEQNPVMGTEDQYSLDMDHLLGIEENGDDCSPIEQTAHIERWDRAKIKGGRPVDVVPGHNGLYAAERHANLPAENAFVKP